jgi:hypothetical protein
MTADFTKPTVASPYTDFPVEIREMFDALAKLFDGAAALNTPTGAKRFDDATKMLQKFNGTAWVDALLKAADSVKLNGQDAAYYRNAGNLNAGIVPLARLSSATETAKGIVELATNAETSTGTDATRAVTPVGLKPLLDAKASLVSPGAFTGDISTSNKVVAGSGSGSIALTANDGLGNANVCFNHSAGVPDVTGSSGRIVCQVDSASAEMLIQLQSATTAGVFILPSTIVRITESGMYINSDGNKAVLHAGNYATQAEAEAGTASDKVMSPLRVAQAIEASGGALTNGYVNSDSLTHGDLYDILSPYVPNVDDRIPAIGGVVNHPDSTLAQSGIIVHEIWRNTATSIAVRGSAVSRGFGSGTYWWTGSLAETLNSGATSPIRIYYLQW